MHSCSQNRLFLINKLLISNKWQKMSIKLEANFNTNTSKTTTCVSHHICCASLTNTACAWGGGALGEIGAHALSFINSATQESWEEDKEEDSRPTPATLNHCSTSMKERNERKRKGSRSETNQLHKTCVSEGGAKVGSVRGGAKGENGGRRRNQSPPSPLPPSKPSSFLSSSLAVRLVFFGIHFFSFAHYNENNKTQCPSSHPLTYRQEMMERKKEVGQQHFAIRWDEEDDAKSWGRNHPGFPVSGFPNWAFPP